MRIVHGILTLCLAGSVNLFAQNSEPAKVTEYLKSLPAATAPAFTEEKKETLASFAISCTDHPQENTGTRNNYLWGYEKMPLILDGYDRNRAFFGCANWHDAVGSTWMLMSLLRQDPKITLGSDIKDIATTHFRKTNIDGEVAFFSAPRPAGEGGGGGGFNFEEPYGYSWLLKLYGETKGGNFADGKKMATSLAPLARWMSEKYVYYLYNLKFPFRSGSDTNTAWAMSLTLDGVNLSEDTTLQTAVHANAIRLFGKDKNCPTGLEPQNADNVSSCLTEAALMGRVMEQADYLKWLDAFLPPVYSEAFQGYAKDIDTSHTSTTGPDAQVQLNAKSHLIGLSFQRAYDLLVISYALPKDDPRVAVFKNLAAVNAKNGYDKIATAGYEGQHWLATYALLYENAAKGPAPLAPEKPKHPERLGADAAPDGN
jgi:Protein of unknown function (DUF2891)